MPWISEGLKTLPVGAGTVLADTGELSAGNYSLFSTMLSADLAATFEIQWRNAANSANIWSQRFYTGALSPVVINEALYFPSIEDDQRIRVVLIGALTLGNAQASFFLT
jgi:hypothetical protein